MEKNEVLERVRAYNQKLSMVLASPLEKAYIEQINEQKYFYGFHIKEMKMFSEVSQFIDYHHSFRHLLPNHYQKLCGYLHHIQEFTCNKNLIRMDARSRNFAYYEGKVKNAIGAFYLFYGADLDMKDLVYGSYRQLFSGIDFSCVIARELFEGNEQVIQYCKDVLTSENNTAVITRDVIKAIEQSHHQELQDLLTHLFLAARLQEGLRQAVIETVDEHQTDYFLKMLDVIKEHQLLRYSSVQRGVLTWVGLGYDIVDERHIQFIFDTVYDYLHNEAKRDQALTDENPLSVYLALYAKGVFDVDEAIQEACDLLDSSKSHLIASALIYLKLSCHFDVRGHAEFMEKYHDHRLIMGLYLSECLRYDFTKMALNKEEARFFFKHIEPYVSAMKEQQAFTLKGFEWFSVSLYKRSLISLLFQLIQICPEQDLVDAFLPYVASALINDRLALFMKEYLPYASLDKRKAFMLKEIISANEKLSDLIVLEYAKTPLTEKEMIQLEARLKTKKAYARANIIKVLSKQNKEFVLQSHQRLLASASKLVNESALELQRMLPEYFDNQETKVAIKGKNEGFGLYSPEQVYALPYLSKLKYIEKGVLKKKKYIDLHFLQVWSKKQILEYIALWDQRIEAHAHDEYQIYGEYRQVGGQYFFPIDYQKKSLDGLPLGSVWRAYFEEDQLTADIIFQLQFASKSHGVYFDKFVSPEIELIALTESDTKGFKYFSHYCKIINYYFMETSSSDYRDKAFAFLEIMNHHTRYKQYQKQMYNKEMMVYSIASLEFFQFMVSCLGLDEASDEVFKAYFPVLYESYVKFNLDCDKTTYAKLKIPVLHLSRAVLLELLPQAALLEGILDTHYQKSEKINYYSAERGHQLFEAYRMTYFKGRRIYGKPDFELPENHPEAHLYLRETLDLIADTLLPMEAARINDRTDVTEYMSYLYVLRGLKYLILALHVLENEDLKRTNYSQDRNAVFTDVMKHAYPLATDTAGMLEAEHFPEKRLVETAMMAPQWIDFIAEVLKWPGFKEACYYFIAHMKQYNAEEKKAEIVQYTDLEPQDLSDGAFDLAWCQDIYRQLGEQRMKMIYDASKFLCDNAFHTRARKYADACLGKTGKEVFLKQVLEKRNKDALSAYCICPIADDHDLLERYIVVQKFLKESKQFGAQRQASEKRAAEIALMNLARNSRFEHVTRLTWMMESEMITQYQKYLKPQIVEDIEVWIEIDDQGRSQISARKNNKQLKSIPARLKKHALILEIKRVQTMWKEQYQRSRQMLETAMEERTAFSLEEIKVMMKNPIVSPMLGKLVLISGEQLGFYADGKLKGIRQTVDAAGAIRIAHPFDLYQNHCWQAYQETLFEVRIVQPFKQVFRELYLKLEDELSENKTRRYSGYQIQPKKAAAVLKKRRWNVSYENGLERVYHKENLVANLYADADWFSPSDIEAPSIDYVTFSSRKDYQPVSIKDIDDVLYSEVMRDVDLAVSTAYVGGVDPVTSFATIELRQAIVVYTCQLMHLTNVEISGHFANIRGKLNDYSVHLGSGIIHQKGGPSLHIVPVYSEKRGKLYLPFLDEDPLSAQILSKIILLSEDYKIKDPAILSQIISEK